MYKLTGVLKKEEINEFTKKDGTMGKNKTLFIEPLGSIYPVKVSASDIEFKAGKLGETITVEVEVYPYFIQDKKQKRAFMNIYIAKK